MPLIDIPLPPRRELSEAVLRKVGELDPINQEAFLAEFTKLRKSVHIAFWLFLVGFHYLCLGRYVLQILFWITFGGFGVWWLIDLFRAPGMVRDRNRSFALQALREVQILSSPSSR